MRVFDIRRAEYYSGKVNKNIWENLQKAIKKFLEITSSKKEEEQPTRANTPL